MINYEEVKEVMKERGYYLHNSSAFAKQIVDGLFIHASVTLSPDITNIQLYFCWKHLVISTPHLDFNHPFFSMFESEVEKAALILNDRSTSEFSYYGRQE